MAASRLRITPSVPPQKRRAVVPAPPDHAAYGGCRECGVWRGGEAWGAVSPALVSPPAPPFRRRPFRVRIFGRWKNPSPFACCARSLGGNRAAASFVSSAAALRVPPPEIPCRSLNTPVPPQSCGGRSRVRRRDASRTTPALPRWPASFG